MKRVVLRIGGLVMLLLVLSAAAASAQDAPGGAPQLRWSLGGAAGVQLDYTGTVQSVGFGFAPTRGHCAPASPCASEAVDRTHTDVC